MHAKNRRFSSPKLRPAVSDLQPSHDEIAQLARIIWEAAGRPNGHAAEHWLQAESQLRHNRSVAAGIPKSVVTRRFGKNGSRRGQPDIQLQEF